MVTCLYQAQEEGSVYIKTILNLFKKNREDLMDFCIKGGEKWNCGVALRPSAWALQTWEPLGDELCQDLLIWRWLQRLGC